MHFFQLAVLVWFHFRIITAQASNDTKRGLVVKIASNGEDDRIWDRPDSDLTWYYNYDSKPLDLYDGSKLEFVPMCWGQAAAKDFLTNVESALQKGSNISYVLGFNEPDTTSAVGGSSLNPQVAAQVWMQYIEPLASKGVKLGAPACSGAPTGLQWLREFFNACDQCTIDFVPLHWYGNFEGLASHVGEYIAAFNRSTWLTEFALNNASLQDTQAFFKQSTQYMDTLKNVTRYSWFGAFRSNESNVGPNAAMLDSEGQLTDIGSWYLGGGPTGNIPDQIKVSNAWRLFSVASWQLLIMFACYWVFS